MSTAHVTWVLASVDPSVDWSDSKLSLNERGKILQLATFLSCLSDVWYMHAVTEQHTFVSSHVLHYNLALGCT